VEASRLSSISIEGIQKKLQEEGFKLTLQRQATVEILLEHLNELLTAEEIYTEATFETLKEKIKKIFEYAKKWVVSLFAKFTTWLDSYVKGDLAYLKKYEKDIKANAKNLTKERTFKMGLTEEKFLAISAGKAIDLTETTSVVFRDLSTDNDKNQELLAKAKEEASDKTE